MRLLMLILLLPSFALAQINDRRPIETEAILKADQVKYSMETAPYQLGSWFVDGSLAMRVAYDSNVFYSEEEEIDDVIATPEAEADTYLRLSSGWVWQNQGKLGYLYYQDLDQIRGAEYDLKSQFHGIFRRLYLGFGADYQRNRNPINSEVDSREEQETTGFGGEVLYNLRPRTLVRLDARQSDFNYAENQLEDDSLRSLEHTATETRLTLIHQTLAALWPSLTVSQRDYDFDSPENLRQSRATGVYLNLNSSQGSGARLSYGFTAGITRLEYDRAESADDDVVELNGTVSYKLNRKWTLSAGVRQAPIFSLQAGYANYESMRYSAGLGYAGKAGIRYRLSAMMGDNQYEESIFTTAQDRSDSVLSTSFNVSAPLSRHLTLDFITVYDERDAETDFQDFNGFYSAVSVSYK